MLFAIFVPSFVPDDRVCELREDFDKRGGYFIFLTKNFYLKPKPTFGISVNIRNSADSDGHHSIHGPGNVTHGNY